jgi:hypothetical protein
MLDPISLGFGMHACHQAGVEVRNRVETAKKGQQGLV